MITTPVAPVLNFNNRRADTWPRHRTGAQQRRRRLRSAARGIMRPLLDEAVTEW